MRALIVDDEELARTRLRQVLASERDVDIVGECTSARELPRSIESLDPDVVFLDIEMPAESGLEAARLLSVDGGPLIVFTTAFERYAFDAFDLNPVDYLLKPIETGRFQRALDRVRRTLALRNGTTLPRKGRKHLDRLFMRTGERMVLVEAAQIERIEAVGNYVKIHTASASSLLRCTLAALELRLDPARFIRTHRSHIVNIRKVREMLPVSHGDYTLHLESGAEAPLSRAYRDRIADFEL
ncbi:MAG: two-component system, LytTR family, response regulator [Acidobacteriota bacterium]|jgi:two-component system LytT family response regulator|nr:two-component system, LytTR family, response regulator [Acidobacteriota bacterium]